MWPGYMTTTRLLSDGIFMNIDTCAKFIQKTTILEQIDLWLSRGKNKAQIQEIFDSSNLDVQRRTVITIYNTKSYQVDGLSFEVTPRTHEFKWKNKGQDKFSNVIEYMKLKYNVKITRPDQPMLWVNFRDEMFYLPTELCHEAALPDNFT
jgi:hypothetical protein